MNLFVLGIGVFGPGLEDWPTARAILMGPTPHILRATAQPVPHILPTTERRRSSEVVRLAITVADEALTMSGLPRQEVSAVFASSDGDGAITHKICESLAGSRDVSPTLFHNSVNNAPAGYWSIASESQSSSTSLCAYDSSFAAGLLEAAVQVTVEQQPVLLVGYDLPFPNPLRAVRTVDYSFAAAFVLAPHPWGVVPLMHWQVRLEPIRLPTKIPAVIDHALHNNPSARCLPLLVALASRQAQSVSLDYLYHHSLVVTCEP